MIFTKYYYNDQSKEDMTGVACGTHAEDEKFLQKFGWKA
jgi:hypothetical protein